MAEWKIDPFDTDLLGVRSAKLWLSPGDAVSVIDEALEAIGPAFVAAFVPYSRVHFDHLHDVGFRLISVRASVAVDPARADTSFELSSPMDLLRIGDLRRDDAPSLDAFASIIGGTSRYFKDELIPADRSLELYRTWIRNSVHGGVADEVLVARVGDQAVGYHSFRLRDGIGYADLLGVLPEHRGGGLGKALFRMGVAELFANGATRVEVVTEAENVGAMRMYEAVGFLLHGVDFVFHRHTETDGGGSAERGSANGGTGRGATT